MISIIERLKKIEYRLLKEYDVDDFSDQKLIFLAQSIVNAAVDQGTILNDPDMPTSMFGVTIDWTIGPEANDLIVKFSRGTTEVTQDLAAVNVVIPGYYPDIEQMYSVALGMLGSINGENVPDVGYTETNKSIAISDALLMVLEIN